MKDSRKQFIIEGHKAACSEWKTKIEKEFPKLFKETEFKKDVWYKQEDIACGTFILSQFNGERNAGQYGFNAVGNWSDSLGTAWLFGTTMKVTVATDKEVGDALIKEAKKRGFKEGVSCLWVDEDIIHHNLELEFNYNTNGYLCMNNHLIFEYGKWATIIETITKAEAEKELGKTIICEA